MLKVDRRRSLSRLILALHCVVWWVRCSIFTPGVGWSESPETLSRNDEAGDPVVGLTDDGRAYAVWQDDKEIWFGRYE